MAFNMGLSRSRAVVTGVSSGIGAGIAPGFIDTQLATAWFDSFPDPRAKRTQIERLHPVGRLGLPVDVAALCTFLCSPLAGFISGSTILIDGGRSAAMQGS